MKKVFLLIVFAFSIMSFTEPVTSLNNLKENYDLENEVTGEDLLNISKAEFLEGISLSEKEQVNANLVSGCQCLIYPSFNLTSGTNRFRTLIQQPNVVDIKYTVTDSATNIIVGSQTVRWTFSSCTQHYNIVDLDNFASIQIGKLYKLNVDFVPVSGGSCNGAYGPDIYFTGE